MERLSERMSWIQDLVRSEEQMEQTGLVDLASVKDQDRYLQAETQRFLQTLKQDFIEASSSFNDLRNSVVGRIKIYGVAKTHADFMLFRNGFKMIFAYKEQGKINIRFNFIGPNYMSTPAGATTATVSSANIAMMEEHLLEARTGALGKMFWTVRGETIEATDVVRYYMTMFIRETAK